MVRRREQANPIAALAKYAVGVFEYSHAGPFQIGGVGDYHFLLDWTHVDHKFSARSGHVARVDAALPAGGSVPRGK